MKTFTALSIAAGTLVLSASASAQVRTMGPHAETQAALECLLSHDHGQKQKECEGRFVGGATREALFWTFWDHDKDFALGPLVSSDYAGTQAVNAYLVTRLNSRVTR